MRCRAWEGAGPGFGCASGLARCCVRPLDGEELAAQTGITADPRHGARRIAGAGTSRALSREHGRPGRATCWGQETA
jgi:hypothetical protein